MTFNISFLTFNMYKAKSLASTTLFLPKKNQNSRHPNKVSISVVHKLRFLPVIPTFFISCLLFLLCFKHFFQFLAFFLFLSGISCCSSYNLRHYFLPFIAVVFHPTFCLEHKPIFNLSMFCTSGRSTEFTGEKDYTADDKCLRFDSCVEKLLDFILQKNIFL